MRNLAYKWFKSNMWYVEVLWRAHFSISIHTFIMSLHLYIVIGSLQIFRCSWLDDLLWNNSAFIYVTLYYMVTRGGFRGSTSIWDGEWEGNFLLLLTDKVNLLSYTCVLIREVRLLPSRHTTSYGRCYDAVCNVHTTSF